MQDKSNVIETLEANDANIAYNELQAEKLEDCVFDINKKPKVMLSTIGVLNIGSE